MKQFLLFLALVLGSVSAFATSIPLTPLPNSGSISTPGSSFGTTIPVSLIDGSESFSATGLSSTINISPTQTLYIYTSGFLSATTGSGVISGTFSNPTFFITNGVGTINAPFVGTVNGVAFSGTLIQTIDFDVHGVGTLGQGSLTSLNGGGSPVPEPGSLVLLGTGLLGIAGIRRRVTS